MSVERVIIEFRRNADRLRAIKDGGRDGQMNEYFNSRYAAIWDEAANMVEEAVEKDKT